jgi:hypothetical protein
MAGTVVSVVVAIMSLLSKRERTLCGRANAYFFCLYPCHFSSFSGGCLFPILTYPALFCVLSYPALSIFPFLPRDIFLVVGAALSFLHGSLCPCVLWWCCVYVALLVSIVTSKDWFRLREVGRAGVVNIFFSVNIKTLGSSSSWQCKIGLEKKR